MDVQIRKIAWGAPKNIIAYHSTKIGGWSNGAFKFSNMSLDVGDNPKDVNKNRDSMIKQLSLNNKPVFMKQIHSATVRVAKSPSDNLVCDSCYTTVKGLPLAVLSADCLPILISSSDGNKIGVIHAGWRGLASGIIQKFLKRFARDPKDVVVWIGPSINPENYIIREDVFNKLSGISTKFFSRTKDVGAWHLDLKYVAKIILKQEGVEKIFLDNICTFSNPDQYYSYRRENQTGRVVSIICIDSDDNDN